MVVKKKQVDSGILRGLPVNHQTAALDGSGFEQATITEVRPLGEIISHDYCPEVVRNQNQYREYERARP